MWSEWIWICTVFVNRSDPDRFPETMLMVKKGLLEKGLKILPVNGSSYITDQ